jgi:putative ATPase
MFDTTSYLPLAARLRPNILDDFVGQTHLLSPNKPLMNAIQSGKPHSMILWGPPGSGKTTLAKLLAKTSNMQTIALSAVSSGLKEVREAIDQAVATQHRSNQQTLLFIDEIHRFNKAQQDVFLQPVEEGKIILIGATTENPSFEINNALLSRCRVYVLKTLEETDLLVIINRAIDYLSTDLEKQIQFDPQLRKQLVQGSQGDARQALNLLELTLENATEKYDTLLIDENAIAQAIQGLIARFDKGGDLFYDQISALHKSVRGSSPDAALYWFARMLKGGADPLYIARRVVRMASEDIGNADPKALDIALSAWEVQERLGSPEGELAVAQAITYLAVAPKSNAIYVAFKAAMQDADRYNNLEVPIHIRNAPTSLMKTLGHGKAYRYDHDEPNAHAKGQTYFPEKMGEKIYYEPTSRGLEIKIREKLEILKSTT